MLLTASSVMLSRPSSKAVTIMRASSWPRVGSSRVWALRRSSSSSPPTSRRLKGWAALRGFWGWKRCWGRKRHVNIQMMTVSASGDYLWGSWISAELQLTWMYTVFAGLNVRKILTSNFCLEEHFFFPFGLPGFDAEPACHCNGPAPSSGR